MTATRTRATAMVGLTLLVSASLGSVSELGAQSRPARQYTIEQFLNTVAISGASFSADESRLLFSSNKTGIFNVYTVPVKGGEPTAITSSTTDSTYAVSFFRTDDRILFTRDQGGNELNHLYVRMPDGQERDLTPGQKLKAMFAGWAPDGKAFYVQTNERDQRFFDVYRYDATTYERTLFFKNEQGFFPNAVSDDGKWLSLWKVNTTLDSDVHVFNADTQQTTHVSGHKGMAQYNPAPFDRQSTYLYYLTDDGGEFSRLRRYHLKTGAHEDVQKASWDIVFTSFSQSGRYRVTGINEDGRIAISVIDTKTNAPVTLPSIPDGQVSGVAIARSEKRLAFYVNGDRSPNNLFVHELGGTQITRLTNTLSPEIDAQDLVDSQVVRFKSFDGMEIPSIFYKPHQATPERKAPALVWVHGGPGGQTGKGYSAVLQYLANHGYVVLGINNRGSSGYGKTFFAADDQKHGKEPLWDCVEGKKYLASLPYVDPNRIGIIGGSYGGYMVLAALAFKPDAFAVGVDIFGVANWVRTLENIPPWWEAQKTALFAEMGDPAKHKDMLREISPVFHADKIRKPLLVLQGANDPRVLKAESDDIVAEVKKNGVPIEYIVFADEGHGFSKKKNQIEGYGAVLRFLDKHLKGAPASTPSAGQ